MAAGPMLAQPVQVRGVHLRNRIIGAPMERNYCDRSGRVTKRYVDYLVRRAAGGVGLLFTESCYVAQEGKARDLQMGLHADHVIDGLETLAGAIHAEGGTLGVELNHGGRVVPSAVSQQRPVAPSPIPCAEIGGEVPRELTLADIDGIVAQFARAARRAVDAGVDVIAVHAAHGYLIGQFLSPRSNQRTDEYRDPTLFLNQVLGAVRSEVEEATPISLRLSAFEGLPDGLDEDETLALADRMRLDRVDVVDLSAGTYGAGQWITPSGEVDEGYLAPIARRYRSTGCLVSVAGRITTREAANRVLDGSADLVVVGRALHADPDWARHAIDGTRTRPCISCNQGCADVIHKGLPLWCAVNPETGNEGNMPSLSHRTRQPLRRRVVVVGGGPAGMEAARVAARSGFAVRLVEHRGHLGGQFALAARLRSKPQFHRLIGWYEQELADLGVDIALGRSVTIDDVQIASTAAIVVATGGLGYTPSVPGSASDRVVDIRSWLADAGSEPTDSAVTVWGADRAATYVADELAGRGCDVVIIASADQLAEDAGARERKPAVDRLIDAPNVRLELSTTVERIHDDRIVGTRLGEEIVIRHPGPVIVSHGTVPAPIPSVIETLPMPIPMCIVGEVAGGETFDEAIASAQRETTRLCSETDDRPLGTI